MAKVDRLTTIYIGKSKGGNGIGGVSGSSGYDPIMLNGRFTIRIIILDDDSAYVMPAGGYLFWKGTGLVHGTSWPLRMVGDTYSFKETTASKRDLYTPILCRDIAEYQPTYCRYDLPNLGDGIKVGDTLPSWCSGYRCKKSFNSWEKVATNKRAYYLAFPAHNNGGDVNKITFSSVRIVMSSPIFDPDYFPGEICQNEDNWSTAVSCNRSGGYFRRQSDNNADIDRKNTPNNISSSTVHIHDGSSWNIIAPKIGQGS